MGRKRLLSTNSDGLLVHFHGGGFVAQSSKSHEVSRNRVDHDVVTNICNLIFATVCCPFISNICALSFYPLVGEVSAGFG